MLIDATYKGRLKITTRLNAGQYEIFAYDSETGKRVDNIASITLSLQTRGRSSADIVFYDIADNQSTNTGNVVVDDPIIESVVLY